MNVIVYITTMGTLIGVVPFTLITTRAIYGSLVFTDVHTSLNTGMTASSTMFISSIVTLSIIIGQVSVFPTRFRKCMLVLKSLVMATRDPLRKLLALLVCITPATTGGNRRLGPPLTVLENDDFVLIRRT